MAAMYLPGYGRLYRNWHRRRPAVILNMGPYFSNSIPEAGFSDNLWCEPSPFNPPCEYGLAMAHAGNYGWLSTANGVWRTSLADASLDITADVLEVKYESLPKEGRLQVTLRNDDGKYQSPSTGNLALLNSGS